jgi:hypothetical protein
MFCSSHEPRVYLFGREPPSAENSLIDAALRGWKSNKSPVLPLSGSALRVVHKNQRNFGGSDGTRTRDLLRDRQAF